MSLAKTEFQLWFTKLNLRFSSSITPSKSEPYPSDSRPTWRILENYPIYSWTKSIWSARKIPATEHDHRKWISIYSLTLRNSKNWVTSVWTRIDWTRATYNEWKVFRHRSLWLVSNWAVSKRVTPEKFRTSICVFITVSKSREVLLLERLSCKILSRSCWNFSYRCRNTNSFCRCCNAHFSRICRSFSIVERRTVFEVGVSESPKVCMQILFLGVAIRTMSTLHVHSRSDVRALQFAVQAFRIPDEPPKCCIHDHNAEIKRHGSVSRQVYYTIYM